MFRPPFKTVICFTAVLMAFMLSGFAHAEKAADKNKTPENMVINSETGDVDMEAEVIDIPGAVTIDYGDLHIRGRNLKFNNKTTIAELSGNPLVAELGNGLLVEAGKMVLDINSETAAISGGCRVTQIKKDVTVEVESEKIDTNFGRKGWAKSSGEVKIHYKKTAAEGGDKSRKPGDDSAKKQPMIDTDEIFATAGSVYYTFDPQIVEASHTVRIQLKEGVFSADAMKGDVEKQKLTVTGGAQGKIKDVTFKADHMNIDYGTKEADLTGGVYIDRDNGDHFQTDHVWFRYKDKAGSMKTGRLKAELKVDVEKLKQKIGPGKQAPEGGKP
jgi:lipopolysaccharide assembly outer membrane protein LptD (OstA)